MSSGTKKVSGEIFRTVFNAGRPSGDPTMWSNLVTPQDESGGTVGAGPDSTYVPTGPVRLLDSRDGTGLAGTFSANTPRVLPIAGRGGVPAGATAVTVNLTVVNQTAGGYVSLTPLPTATPATSTLNFPAGDIRANGATVPLAPDGSLALVYRATAGARTHLVLDVTGYVR